MSSARAAVVAHAINIERERRRRVRADVEADRFAGANARARTVALDPWAAILGLRVNATVRQQPVACAGFFVLAVNQIISAEN